MKCTFYIDIVRHKGDLYEQVEETQQEDIRKSDKRNDQRPKKLNNREPGRHLDSVPPGFLVYIAP